MGKKVKKSKKLLKLCKRENWTCYLCELPVPINAANQSPMAASRDHVIPRARLRKRTYDQSELRNNLRLAHSWCNGQKGCRVHPPEKDTYAEGLIDAQLEYEVKEEQEQPRPVGLMARIPVSQTV
jgi:5-methylcytosine-specific restriction endonuclease McrA